MALVKGGRDRMGETLFAPELSGTHAVKVCEPIFYDKTGERQNVE